MYPIYLGICLFVSLIHQKLLNYLFCIINEQSTFCHELQILMT